MSENTETFNPFDLTGMFKRIRDSNTGRLGQDDGPAR